MLGDLESKWSKAGERGNKRAYNNRGSSRGDAETFHYKSTRKEDTRSSGNKLRSVTPPRQTRDLQH